MRRITAYGIMHDLLGADLVIDIHSSNIFLREVPQARISTASAKELMPIAEELHLDFIWIHEAVTVLEATLAHALNERGTPVVVVEMGVGLRITQEYGERLTQGILNIMRQMDMWSGDVEPSSTQSVISITGNVEFFNASSSGVFIPYVDQSMHVQKGQVLGEIVDPLAGTVLETIAAKRGWPCLYHTSLPYCL